MKYHKARFHRKIFARRDILSNLLILRIFHDKLNLDYDVQRDGILTILVPSTGRISDSFFQINI